MNKVVVEVLLEAEAATKILIRTQRMVQPNQADQMDRILHHSATAAIQLRSHMPLPMVHQLIHILTKVNNIHECSNF